MTARAPEEFNSHESAERRKKGEGLSSQELLDEIMEGPRLWADTFNELISERYPTGGLDLQSDDNEKKASREIDSQLRQYRESWLRPHLSKTNKQLHSIVANSFEPLDPKNEVELVFHKISQTMIPQWYRALVSSRGSKSNNFHPETAQILLAIEGAKIITLKKSSSQPEYFNDALTNLDAMITLLQMSIDGEMHGMPDSIVLPHPQIGREDRVADFLIFESSYNDTYNMIEVLSENIVDASLKPGTVAVSLLKSTHYPTISRRPDFSTKEAIRDFMRARETIRDFLSTADQPELVVQNATRHIGEWILNKANETEPPKEDS